MKVFSQLEKAQLENTTADTAAMPKGLATYRTDLNIAKVSNGTVMKALIDEDSTQTMSNKTLVTPNVTGAQQFSQVATPATPAAGFNKFYYKLDGKLYTLDSAGNEALVGSGGGGGVVNLVTNGNADDSASSIFVPYLNTAQRLPVTGAGGSPTVTTSVTSTAPLTGTKSYLLTKPASNTQGQGWSVASFTVDPSYRAKVLSINIDYIVNSGTFVAGTSTTDSDVIWYIFDITNNTLIEPSSIKLLSNSSTISDKFQATFQTSATGSSYRLIAHVATTSALAYVLKVDNVTVSPSVYVYGTPITDDQTYVPIITAAVGTISNYTTDFKWRREGDYIQISGAILFTGATGTWTQLRFTIPSGIGFTVAANAIEAQVGTWNAMDAGVLNYGTGYLVPVGANVLGLRTNKSDGVYLTNGETSNTIPFSFGAGDSIYITPFKLKVNGWSSSVQMSDQTDTRVVALQASRITSSQSVSGAADVKVQWNSVTKDTHAAFDSVTNYRYTVLVSGSYDVKGVLHCGASSGASAHNVVLYKNGSSSRNLFNTVASTTSIFSLPFNTQIDAVVGDYFEIYINTGNQTTPILSSAGATGGSQLNISRVSGPSAIAASETIAAVGNQSSGQSFPHNATTAVNWNNIILSTHGTLSGTTYTANSAQIIEVTAQVGLSGIGSGVQYTVQLSATVGSDTRVFEKEGTNTAAFTSSPTALLPSQIFRMLAGQTLTVSLYHFNSGSTAVAAAASRSFVNIKRIGI